MDWAGVAKITGILAILSILSVWAWFILRNVREKGKEEGRKEAEKKTDEATKKLAESLYNTSGDDFIVLHKDGWGNTSSKT